MASSRIARGSEPWRVAWRSKSLAAALSPRDSNCSACSTTVPVRLVTHTYRPNAALEPTRSVQNGPSLGGIASRLEKVRHRRRRIASRTARAPKEFAPTSQEPLARTPLTSDHASPRRLWPIRQIPCRHKPLRPEGGTDGRLAGRFAGRMAMALVAPGRSSSRRRWPASLGRRWSSRRSASPPARS